MSGIVGIINLDGAPVEEPLLRRMTESLIYRGPDRRNVWLDGSVGFGHTLLSTTPESREEEQPASLDGLVWITADARVDARAELVRELESFGSKKLPDANDAELILHAYHAWDERCVEHLLGDFAFAIWDGRKRRLWCARDHFGIKPFYYAHVAGRLVFSNTLDCVRVHPGVGRRLNEQAIGDFLVFGWNEELTTTVFADVQRLPPAHSLTCEPGSVRVKPYWTLPSDGRIRYRRSDEYVDHFKQILDTAVEDRLRTSRVGVLMSGGLDSTYLTATARRLLADRGAPFDLRAHTIVYDSLIPDSERYYAGLAAGALDIEIDYLAADGYRVFEGWDDPDLNMPEPEHNPFLLLRQEQLRQTASHARVALNGEGGDSVFWPSYVIDLLGRMPWRELGADIARSLVLSGVRPGVGLRDTLKKWLGRGSTFPPFPTWLNGDFAERVGLRTRWRERFDPARSADHPVRTEAYQGLATAPWTPYFEFRDPGATRLAVESRYPYLDVRLVAYMLAIPPIPWCVGKHLLRFAVRDALPDPVRLRPKTGLAVDPLRAQLMKTDAEWLDRIDSTPELAQYVDRTAVPQLAGGCNEHEPWLNIRPLCLDYWLRRMRRS